ncbi:MAG TPA: hypothetical protein VK119_10965 [Bacillota bacterium]|nr:hypothetical protein [Bacillota bacterium]
MKLLRNDHRQLITTLIVNKLFYSPCYTLIRIHLTTTTMYGSVRLRMSRSVERNDCEGCVQADE